VNVKDREGGPQRDARDAYDKRPENGQAGVPERPPEQPAQRVRRGARRFGARGGGSGLGGRGAVGLKKQAGEQIPLKRFVVGAAGRAACQVKTKSGALGGSRTRPDASIQKQARLCAVHTFVLDVSESGSIARRSFPDTDNHIRAYFIIHVKSIRKQFTAVPDTPVPAELAQALAGQRPSEEAPGSMRERDAGSLRFRKITCRGPPVFRIDTMNILR
jgi:hypothetical protein